MAVLLGGYFLAIPLLARLGAGTSSINSSTPLGSSDNIPPAAPKINSLPDATRTKILTISGEAESGATVSILVNDVEKASTIVLKQGTFQQDITLSAGINSITVRAKDIAGNISHLSKPASIIYDAIPPVLTISSPAPALTESATPILVIAGKTEVDAEVAVNDRKAIVAKDGSFTTTTSLIAGANRIVITATDRAGNISKEERTIAFTANQASPSAQPLATPTP